MKVVIRIIVIVVGITIAASAFGQISLQSPSARNKNLTIIEGRVTKLEWTNPRSNIYLAVSDPDSNRVTNWVVRTGIPNDAAARRIRLTDLRVGMLIKVKGALAGQNELDAAFADISFPTSN